LFLAIGTVYYRYGTVPTAFRKRDTVPYL